MMVPGEAAAAVRSQPFRVMDCALAAIATGRRAQNLRELRDGVQDADLSSIYYHFWGVLLRPHFDDPEYSNDFAVWARHGLHDKVLAERLSAVDPTDFADQEALRQELLEVIEERLDEMEHVPWAQHDNGFYFVRSQIVVFDTHVRVTRPEELADVIPEMSLGSVFYHTIDARRRTPHGQNDFSAWLEGSVPGYQDLCDRFNELDPYFFTLSELRDQLTRLVQGYFEVPAR